MNCGAERDAVMTFDRYDAVCPFGFARLICFVVIIIEIFQNTTIYDAVLCTDSLS